MAFKLYFAGSRTKQDEEVLKQQPGLLRLLSYGTDQQRIDEYISEGRGNLFVDSGAYSAWTKGIALNLDEYIKFVNERDAHIGLVAQLDKIPGQPGQATTPADMVLAANQSWVNYLYMRDRVVSPDKLVPVYHYGVSIAYLMRLLQFQPGIKHMAFGALVGATTQEREAWMGQAFRAINMFNRQDITVHGFGMTNLPLCEQFPLDSADSTSWIQYSVNGRLSTLLGDYVISEGRSSDPLYVGRKPKAVQDQLRAYLAAEGFDMTLLMTSTSERIRWHVHHYSSWAKQYQYRPKVVQQGRLFGVGGQQ